MNKLVRETVRPDMCLRDFAIAAATDPPAVTGLMALGANQRKAMFHVTVTSATLDNDGAFVMGIVDDTVALPAASGDLAALAAADRIKFGAIAAETLAQRATSMTVAITAAAGVVVVNGVVFTYDATPLAENLEWVALADLVDRINENVPGVTASDTGLLDLVVDEIGDTLSFSSTVAAITADDIIIRAFAVVMEADASEMATGATGVYAVVDFLAGLGAVDVDVTCIRGNDRYTPEHAAHTVL